MLVNGAGRIATPGDDFSQPMAVTPLALTDEAVVKVGGAVLLGLVDPKTEETDVWFEWGKDPALTEVRSSARQLVHYGTGIQPISYELSGLQSGATYYFRIVAFSSLGKSEGKVKSFNPL